MNYDNNQQYGFNLGLAAAAAAAAAASQQQPAPQNVAGSIYPYALPGPGDLQQQQQQLSAKVAALGQQTTVAALAGKSILYSPQQHQLQQQQQQQHLQHQQPLPQQQHGSTFSLVQGQAMVGRQNMFPMAAGLSLPQEPLCSPQSLLDAYGSLSPNMVGQKVAPSAAALATPAYKNFGWMNISQANNNSIATVTNNISTNNNTSAGTPINNQPSLPSIGHLLSHLQQQQQKQQTSMTALFHSSQQPPPQQHQQNIANFQSIHVFQGTPTANLQMSPGGLQVSPGSIQVSPTGQAFQVPHSLQNALSPNTMGAAGVGFSGLRQVQVSAAVGGMVGGGLRNQVVMAPRGQVIMTQAFPQGNSSGGEMKNFQPVAKLAAMGPGAGLGVRAVMGSHVNIVSAPPPVAASVPPNTTSLVTSSAAVGRNDPPVPFVSQVSCNHLALTTTTVTVTTSSCSLATTLATTVHTSVSLATSAAVLANMSPASCQHGSPHPSHGTHASDLDTKEEGGCLLSPSPSTPLTAASTSTPGNGSEEVGSGGVQVVKVPYSWRRELVSGAIVYFSPSNVCLSSLEQIQTYLSKSGTCKCGLECPLQVGRTFNFDPAVEGKPWSMEDVTCSQDLTKLCNHKRKVLALAAFQNSTVGQDTQGKADGPAAKLRKRDKGKLGDNLLVSPLVADSKLKTSITNAVNKHAAATAQSLSNSHNTLNSSASAIVSSAQSTSSVDEAGLPGSLGQVVSTELGTLVPNPQHAVPPPPNCVVDRSGSIHYPSQSPMSHSPASMHSTPGISVGGSDHLEGLGPITSHFPGKLDFGRNHACGVVGMGLGNRGMTPNHADSRQFSQSALQCSVFSPEDLKQSYFMQQQPSAHQHLQGQMSMSAMPFMASMPGHSGVPPPGAQTFRSPHPMGMQMQYPVGFPHGQQQGHPQHHYPNAMVCQMNMQQQQNLHPTHQHSQQQAPPPHHHVHQCQPLLRHHQSLQAPPHSLQAPSHAMFQNLRMGSPGVWPPQHLQPHHGGPAAPSGYHSDPHHPQGGTMFPGVYPQMGDLLWLEAGKPKSKRPRSKKDKQKLNSIVDRTSPCGVQGRHRAGGAGPGAAVNMTDLPKCLTPSAPTITTSTPNVFPSAAATTTLPCSVSFLENPAVFVAQQAAIINSSLASCQIDLNSPPHLANPPTSTSNPVRVSSCSAASTTLPVIKVEQDFDEKLSECFPASGMGISEYECKQEPPNDDSMCIREQEKKVCGNSSLVTGVHLAKSQVVVSKLEPSAVLSSQPGSLVSKDSEGGGCGLSQGAQGKKKSSPKGKNRQKTLPAASKLSITNTCLPECVSPVSLPQHNTVPPQPPSHHLLHTGDAAAVSAVTNSVPFQVPDLSQLLSNCGNGGSNWNLMALQLAQYGNSNTNPSTLGGNGDLNPSASGSVTADFPASSLLTAAARAQLSQQAPLNSFLLPAILSANGLTSQDLPLVAAAALQQQQQQQQQQTQHQLPQHDPAVSITFSSNGTAELGPKTSPAMAGTGLLGISPVGVTTLNQACSLPMQVLQGTNMMAAGMMPAATFQGGTLLAQGVQGMQGFQGLPLNVLLPVSQAGLGGPDSLQGISLDMAGNLLASVSVGNTVCKTFNISPKVVTNLVESMSAVSTGSVPGALSPAAPTSTGFPQGCSSMKGMGSTVHHLPQHCMSHTVTQNIGQSIQTQNLGQCVQSGQAAAQNVQGQVFNQAVGQGMAQAVGVNVSVGLGAGEAVVLNSLLPSFLALNTAMPPISLPMVTNVTNSLTQVIPAVATAPALITQQQQQPQQQHAQQVQQQVSAAQFLNALTIPAVAAAAFSNPLLIANPLVAQTGGNPPAPPYPAKVVPDERECDEPVQTIQALGSQAEEKGLEGSLKLEEGGGVNSIGKSLDILQQHQNLCQQTLTVQTSNAFHHQQQQQQQQQQVIVLPGGGLPLMHVLSTGTHQLGAAGVVDKLCNTAQLFLPATPSAAATLSPDLTQLGAVAALTPLGIQQMWNSLNSLQLQQLQTLQLQQLLWQQLQGMQALPPHITTVDASAVPQLQTNFITSLQQQQVQIAASQQQEQQQSPGVLVGQEEEEEEERTEVSGSAGLVAEGVGGDCCVQTELTGSCVSGECLDCSPASSVQSPDAGNSTTVKVGLLSSRTSDQSPDRGNGSREVRGSQEVFGCSETSSPLQLGAKNNSFSAERNVSSKSATHQKPDGFLNCVIKTSPVAAAKTAGSPRSQSVKLHTGRAATKTARLDAGGLSGRQALVDMASVSEGNGGPSKTLFSTGKALGDLKLASYHPTVNGDCMRKTVQSHGEAGSKRRGVKRALDEGRLSAGSARVLSNGTAALSLGGMPVMTGGPGPKIVGQGQCST